MPFNELVRGQQLPDPKAREAEDIKRSTKKVKQKVRRTSVKMTTIQGTLLALGFLFGIALICGIGYVLYVGFQTYIGA